MTLELGSPLRFPQGKGQASQRGAVKTKEQVREGLASSSNLSRQTNAGAQKGVAMAQGKRERGLGTIAWRVWNGAFGL